MSKNIGSEKKNTMLGNSGQIILPGMKCSHRLTDGGDMVRKTRNKTDWT